MNGKSNEFCRILFAKVGDLLVLLFIGAITSRHDARPRDPCFAGIAKQVVRVVANVAGFGLPGFTRAQRRTSVDDLVGFFTHRTESCPALRPAAGSFPPGSSLPA